MENWNSNKKKAQIIKLLRITPSKSHAWYEAYLPEQKITVEIRKPLAA